MSSFDFMNVCRLCLAKDGHLHPIFGGESEVPTISLKITSCLPVKIAREDKLPQKICEQCLYKLDLSYEFWNLTVETEKQLLQWLSGVNSQNYAVTTILNQDIMKGEQSNENRLDGSMMQQVSGHQNSMNMGIDNMCISMIMPNNNQQQITSVPIDTSGSSVQNVQVIAGSSTQTTHDQITQSQTNVSTQQEEEEESSEDEENSDDECDGDEGLPIKEESEEDPNNSRTIEPTTFVNVSLHCDEAGPSGIRQQKITDIQEMTQATDVDPKTGYANYMIPIKIEVEDLVVEPLQYDTVHYAREFAPMIHLDAENESRKSRVAVLSSKTLKNPAQMTKRSSENKDVCSATFMNLLQPTNHANNHHYSKHCDRLKDELHAKQMRVPNDRSYFKFPCFVCKKELATYKALQKHKKLHVRRKQIVCQMCNEKFDNNELFKHHIMKFHIAQNSLNCTVCGKSFQKQSAYKQHLLTHTSTLYVCDICNKKFNQSLHLIRHWKRHPDYRRSSRCLQTTL